MNIHEERVLNKLTEKGPGWTLAAIVILRAKDASPLAKIAMTALVSLTVVFAR